MFRANQWGAQATIPRFRKTKQKTPCRSHLEGEGETKALSSLSLSLQGTEQPHDKLSFEELKCLYFKEAFFFFFFFFVVFGGNLIKGVGGEDTKEKRGGAKS